MDLRPTHAMPMQPMHMHEHRSGALARTLLIGLIAFLTVIDLFGTQAILPAGHSPAKAIEADGREPAMMPASTRPCQSMRDVDLDIS